MKLSDIGEFGFIRRIVGNQPGLRPSVVKGIGDDCAVMDVGGPEYLLVTTDLLVERVHFLMDRCGRPEDLGQKAIAVNVSDIAACGGTPQAAFVSVAIPEHISVEWLDAFYAGMREAAALYQTDIIGGDTTRSLTDFVVNVAMTGRAPKDQVLYRSGARPGDLTALTGFTGESAAGLALMRTREVTSMREYTSEGGGPHVGGDARDALIAAHLRPRAHVKEALILAASGSCRAAIDVSDGLSSDLAHVCDESGVGAVLWEKDLPISQGLADAGLLMGKPPLEWVIHGGEDYVLLAAIKPEGLADVRTRFFDEGLDLHVIGRFTESRGTVIEGCDGKMRPLEAGGWDHFR